MKDVRLGLFGPLMPEGSGPTTTALTATLTQGCQFGSLIVFAQLGSKLPTNRSWPMVRLVPCWKREDPISLIRALRIMASHSREVDGFLFNTYLTMFGRSRMANAIGNLVPPTLALVSRKPVVVYMHNFLETQDVTELGYQPSSLQRFVVRLIEGFLLRCTKVAVPLASQQAIISEAFGVLPRKILLPIEPFGLLVGMQQPPVMVEVHPSEPARVLLLGTWGPQKDLKGVLEALRVAKERGGKFSVSITGAINPHFPEYREEINRVVSTKDYSWLRLLGNLDDTEILNVVLNHDLLILPYNATGGFSGAMSVGAYCGIGIISYDLPQLRETAKELRVEPMFVARGDTNALAQEILSFCSSVRASRESRRPIPRMEYDACIRERVDQLVGMLGPPRGS